MNKSYWIAPLVAFLVFGGIYLNFKNGYVAREKARLEQVGADKQTKLQAEIAARRKVVDEAMQAQEERKKERAAKEAEEKARKEAREIAIDARDKAFHDQEKLTKRLKNLKNDISAEQDEIDKIHRERQDSLDEQAFLKTYIDQAGDNVKSLQDALMKIEAAKAARAAEAAAKKP